MIERGDERANVVEAELDPELLEREQTRDDSSGVTESARGRCARGAAATAADRRWRAHP